jgi:hypothetical protein
MNKFNAWFAENKGPALLGAIFLVLSAITGWFAYGSWDEFSTASQAYSDASAKLSKLSKQNPPPSEANMALLVKSIDSEQNGLNDLLATLRQFRIPPFSGLEKAKPQDAPQLLQDSLRAQVTKLKTQATANGSTLPSGFYLALEEYENRLPSPEDAIPLSKQLTVFSWISEQLVPHTGLILAEFSRVGYPQPQSVKTDRKLSNTPNSPKTELPYENPASLKVSFRCEPSSLRDILNAFSQSPYFLVIDSLQLQNTVTEPPRRDSGNQQTPQAANSQQDGQPAIQRLPIIVGREKINVSLRIRILEFPERQKISPTAAK